MDIEYFKKLRIEESFLNFNRIVTSNVENIYLIKNYIELKFLYDYYDNPSDIQFSWHFFNNIYAIEFCKYCGKPKKLYHKNNLRITSNKIYQNTCGNISCINEYKSESTFEKYGVRNISQLTSIKDKKKNSSLSNYGVDNISKSDIIKDKKKAKSIIKYGCDCVLQNDHIKEKIKSTNRLKYGCDYTVQSEKIKNNIKNTNISKYGYCVPIQHTSIKEKMKNTKFSNSIKRYFNNGYELINSENGNYTIKCLKCNKDFTEDSKFLNQRMRLEQELCTHCNPYKTKSQTENKLTDFIRLLNTDILSSDREVLQGKEIDIYIPSLKIGFEFNGIFWHSDKFKSKHYHQEKKFQAIEQGVNLIHIWEDDWEFKQEIITTRIKNVLGITENKIFARKCSIVEVSASDSKAFLEQNHIQGQIGAKHRLGLIYEGNLISLMTFGMRSGKMEMLRFCNKLGYSVVGGFSKLLKYFKKDFAGVIYSYADLDWSNPNDNVYIKNGFTLVKKTEPGYFWVKNDKRYARQQFQKHKLVAQGFDPSKTEEQIMIERGYLKIYNSGNLLYMYK